MEIVSPGLIKDKKVLLRMDLDIPLRQVYTEYNRSAQGELVVDDDYRLKAGLPTLKLCLENGSRVIIMGHLGRPNGIDVPELAVTPIYEWLKNQGYSGELGSGKLSLLENLRFEKGEGECSMEYAHSLVDLVDPEGRGDVVFVNEAFAAYHDASSTTVLPKVLPHGAGLRFVREVGKLREVRENPKRPLVAIIGGVKIEDKGPAIEALSKIANTVLVGGKIASNITLNATIVAHNVMPANLTEDELDITQETLDLWEEIIKGAKQIIWNGPVGRIENQESRIKNQGTYKLARMILESSAEIIVGGGDTVGFLANAGLLDEFEKKGFISTGGGAMLEFLTKGTLPSIEALE